MSQQKGFTISPKAEAVLYFVALVLFYLGTWNPSSAPAQVRSIFYVLSAFSVVIKYELSQQPKPQITSQQALFSVIAYALAATGGLISSTYGSYWYGGLVVALIGAVLAAYEDLGGQVPQVASPASAPTPSVPATP